MVTGNADGFELVGYTRRYQRKSVAGRASAIQRTRVPVPISVNRWKS